MQKHYDLKKLLDAAKNLLTTDQLSFFEERLRTWEAQEIHFQPVDITCVSDATIFQALSGVTTDVSTVLELLMKNFSDLGYVPEPESQLVA